MQGLHIVALAAGANHLVALTKEHQIYTWGCGEQGQLGRRILERHKALALRPNNVTPRKGRSLVPIVSVVCGSYHTLALSLDGTVYAMGLNNYGQLGLGDHESRATAEAIDPEIWQGSRIVQLGAGEHHSLALGHDGRVFAFGRHDFGQLGIHGLSERAMNVPHPIASFPCPIQRISVGGHHNLALDAQHNRLFTWGYGEMAQLGHGVERDEVTPRELAFPFAGTIVDMAAGGQHSVVLTATVVSKAIASQ